MTVLLRNHVTLSGSAARDKPPLVFAHGFVCDQRMWQLVTPAFAADHCIVTFDHVGAGRCDLRGC